MPGPIFSFIPVANMYSMYCVNPGPSRYNLKHQPHSALRTRSSGLLSNSARRFGGEVSLIIPEVFNSVTGGKRLDSTSTRAHETSQYLALTPAHTMVRIPTSKVLVITRPTDVFI